MSQSEQQYLSELRQHASDSRALLSNAQKPGGQSALHLCQPYVLFSCSSSRAFAFVNL